MALWAFLQVAVQHQSIRNLSTKWIANQGNFQIFFFRFRFIFIQLWSSIMAVLQYVMYSKESCFRSSGFDFFPLFLQAWWKLIHFGHFLSTLCYFCPFLVTIKKNHGNFSCGHIGPFLSTLGHFCPLWSISVHFGLFLSTLGHFCPLWTISVHFWPFLFFFGGQMSRS